MRSVTSKDVNETNGYDGNAFVIGDRDWSQASDMLDGVTFQMACRMNNHALYSELSFDWSLPSEFRSPDEIDA
jgi:hypothetical protein